MNPPSPVDHSLLRWRPRYWLPARVARWGLDPMALRMRMSWVLSVALFVTWVAAALIFQDRFTQSGQEDKFLSFIGLGGTLFLTVGLLFPFVLVDVFAFHRWFLLSGPVPLPSCEVEAVEAFLSNQPKAGPVLLAWLLRHRLDYPHIAHAHKLSEVDWKSLPMLEPPSPAWGLEEVVERARAQRKAEDLTQALSRSTPPPLVRPRL